MRQIIVVIIVMILAIGCKNQDSKESIEIIPSEELIQITKEQFNNDKMKIGKPEIHCFTDKISCTGSVSAKPDGYAEISTPITGIIKSIHFTSGNFVKKGQVLCKLISNDFINLQTDFANKAIETNMLKSNYERQEELMKENIGAKKEFEISQSNYFASKIQLESLQLKLELLGFNTTQIKNGKLYTYFPVVAPISGFIENNEITIGKYTENQELLAKIVNPDKLQIKLNLFEKDINSIKKGQNVTIISSGKNESIAIIKSIGNSIDSKSKSIICLADVTNGKLTYGSYVDAEIKINEKDALALPITAISKSGMESYIFIVDKEIENKIFLKRKFIKLGYESNEYVEILNSQNISKVITHGIYNITTQ